MAEDLRRSRVTIEAASLPVLPRGVRLRHDKGRQRWIMLAPERVLVPDGTAVAVLKLCDGSRTVDGIADALAEEYSAPADVIRADVIELLQDLADRGYIEA